MNETAQNAWFYSHEGERIGPLTFADLKIKAIEGGINPRLDMVWTHGMPEWKPAGEIEDLFERRAPAEVQEGFSPPSDPYRPPDAESPEEFMGKETEWPGARRRSYILTTFLFPALWTYGLTASEPFLTAQFGPETMKVVAPALGLVPFFVLLVITLKRLVNVGMSRWWILGNLIPILNIWLGYRTFACPGGYAFHKKLDGAGIFLAIIYWLMVALIVLAVAAVVALMLGAIGSPETLEQFQEIIRNASAPPP
jgi:uncharacterized membrane protein YhaH (DUF805 family)